MSDFTLSTNMNMPIPTVGVSPGPDYADNLNSSLTIVDGHDHSPGYGVPITPSGLNISSDLSFGGNNATSFRSVRFTAQGSPIAAAADLGCLYESGVDLYYNDGLGNQVRITQSGSVTGATGTITGLPSGTASASFAASTFTFQSATLTAASVDGRNFILRNSAASSKGLTLSPPAAMGSDFTVVLPNLPASQKIMTLDASGNMSAPYVVDNSTIEISTNTIQVKDAGITNAKMAANSVGTSQIIDGNVTYPKLGATNRATANFTSTATTSTSAVAITGGSASITAGGVRPVMVSLQPRTSGGTSYVELSGSVGQVRGVVQISDNQGNVWAHTFESLSGSALAVSWTFQWPMPPPILIIPTAGTYTITAYIKTINVSAGTQTITINDGTLVVQEL